MGPTDRKNERPQGEQKVDDSWLHRLTGNHTTGVIVGLLFVLVLIALIIAMFYYPKESDKIITGFLSLLFAFAGFYTGTKSRPE